MSRKLYRVPLPDSGEIVIVRPLSPLAKRELYVKSEQLFPLPDPKQYEVPAPNPLVPGQMIPGEETEEYQKAFLTALTKRKTWRDVTVIDSGVVINTPEGKEQTIERLAPIVAPISDTLTANADRWLATVKYGLISTKLDVQAVLEAADDNPTEEGVRKAMESFRGDL